MAERPYPQWSAAVTQQNQKKSKRVSTFGTICGHSLDLSMLDLSPVLEVSEMALSTCLSQCSLTVSVNTDCKHPRGSLSSLLTLPITVQSALFHVLIFSRTLSASHCGKSSPLTSRVFKHIRKSVAWLIYVNHGVLWGARHTTSAVYLTAKFSPRASVMSSLRCVSLNRLSCRAVSPLSFCNYIS